MNFKHSMHQHYKSICHRSKIKTLTTGRVGVEKAFEKYIKFCAAHIGPLYIKSHEIYNCFSLLPQICIILNLKINGHVVFKQKLKMLI